MRTTALRRSSAFRLDATVVEDCLDDSASEAEDIAAAVAWLASNEARHVTGIQLPIDLGRTNR